MTGPSDKWPLTVDQHEAEAKRLIGDATHWKTMVLFPESVPRLMIRAQVHYEAARMLLALERMHER